MMKLSNISHNKNTNMYNCNCDINNIIRDDTFTTKIPLVLMTFDIETYFKNGICKIFNDNTSNLICIGGGISNI